MQFLLPFHPCYICPPGLVSQKRGHGIIFFADGYPGIILLLMDLQGGKGGLQRTASEEKRHKTELLRQLANGSMTEEERQKALEELGLQNASPEELDAYLKQQAMPVSRLYRDQMSHLSLDASLKLFKRICLSVCLLALRQTRHNRGEIKNGLLKS